MWAVLAATDKWCENWRNSHILFISVSTTVLDALATGRSKCADIMELLRILFWYSVEYNFYIASVYIKSNDNNACDTLRAQRS